MDDSVSPGPIRPPLPSAGTEFVNTLAHYHRAEIARMAGWRDRIDRTTNWAITVVAAMLSVSLSTPTAHHGVLLFAMLLIWLLLWIEARRYRFFDVYRARVRRMERHYFAAFFDPRPDDDPDWARVLGEDLRTPRFLIGRRAAMSRRLRRNYLWMFLILLLAWVLKITSTKLQDADRTDVLQSLDAVVRNASLGPLPGWLVIALVVLFYLWLAWSALSSPSTRSEDGTVHV
ncbi:DUF2270 domain-containing protein [Alsobacter sp. SYSU BS001988]|jgi:uncharacterized membrane protein